MNYIFDGSVTLYDDQGNAVDDVNLTDGEVYYLRPTSAFPITLHRCLGFGECARRDPLRAYVCYYFTAESDIDLPTSDFFQKLREDGFEKQFPYRLCDYAPRVIV